MMAIHEERDRKCNIYASQNLFQQEPRHDDYDEESDANVWVDKLESNPWKDDSA